MTSNGLDDVSASGVDEIQTSTGPPGIIRNAGHPFDKESADIILRSADNVDFRAHRAILSIAAEIFSDMFSLPEPSDHDIGKLMMADERKDGLPVICMAEDERGLTMLLTFCYPIPQPTLSTAEDIMMGLKLVRKFNLVHIQKPLEMLKVMAQREPERAYAIAITLQLRDVALTAARAALLTRNEDLPLHPEFAAISSFDLIRLRRYHAAIMSAIRLAFTSIKWLGMHLPGTLSPFPISQLQPQGSYKHVCGNPGCPLAIVQDQPNSAYWKECGEGVRILLKPWVRTYLIAADAALARRPIPGIVRGEDIMSQAYNTAAPCPLCREQAREVLPRFATQLVVRLETVISQVELQLPF